MGSMKSSGSNVPANTTQQTTIRFAPYVEERHSNFLTTTYNYRAGAIADNPYSGHDNIDIDSAFFATGVGISSMPALYDMFGKHMSGLDIEDVWGKSFENFYDKPEIDEDVEAEITVAEQEIIDALSAFQIAARNSNCVTSSTFIIGNALIEGTRVKDLSKISLKSKVDLIPDMNDKFLGSLRFNKSEVTTYAEMMKVYYLEKVNIENKNTITDAREILWPFTVMDFERAAIASLQGRGTYQKAYGQRHRSTLSRALFVWSWVINGGSTGFTIWGVPGMLIGASVGFNMGLGMLMLEEGNDLAAARYWLTGGMSGPWEFV